MAALGEKKKLDVGGGAEKEEEREKGGAAEEGALNLLSELRHPGHSESFHINEKGNTNISWCL